MDFHGKVVLVTGASRGIGRAVAYRFAEQGATLVIHYREARAAAEATLAMLRPGEHVTAAADLTDPAQIPPLVAGVVKRFGRVDVLVNNAGIYVAHPILTTD